MSQLQIKLTEENIGYYSIKLAGIFNSQSTEDVIREIEPLVQKDIKQITFDFKKVEQISPESVQFIIHFFKHIQKHQAKVAFTGINPHIRKKLKSSGLTGLYVSTSRVMPA